MAIPLKHEAQARAPTQAARDERARPGSATTASPAAGRSRAAAGRARGVTASTTAPTREPPVGHSMTEQEILAMPAEDYMNPAQLDFFRDRLLRLRRELSERAGQREGDARVGAEDLPDSTDRATVEEQRFVAQRLAEREASLLGKIDAALRRIEEGRYGYCEKTGQPIGIQRLLARPMAILAVEAKNDDEAREAQYAR
ncbi:MAG TPA: TraR/DksA C4-type zinc finger protein [Nevskia sp.]|nr:TraR/DksA C4-type zinc finger protein [Nevskia sp.]